MKRNEQATECFCLTVEDPSCQINSKKTSSLGDYFVEWKRKDTEADDREESSAEADLFVKTKIKLPEIVIESFPFLIEAKLPTFGHLEQHLTVTYTIKNKTQAQILDLECNLDENEFFSIGGSKLVRLGHYALTGTSILAHHILCPLKGTLQVLPNDSTDYSYVAFPLQAGK